MRVWVTTSVVIASTVGGAAYVYNNLNIQFVPAPNVVQTENKGRQDFRARIPNYEIMTNAEKRYAIVNIIGDLEGYEREQAGKELSELAWDTIESSNKDGHVPSGW